MVAAVTGKAGVAAGAARVVAMVGLVARAEVRVVGTHQPRGRVDLISQESDAAAARHAGEDAVTSRLVTSSVASK